MINDINKLAQSIVDSAVPEWLHVYLYEHKARLSAELKLFGTCEIPMPDGGRIICKANCEPGRSGT